MDSRPATKTGQHAPSFGVWLRTARETARLSQEELAERSGLSPNTIGALERGAHRHPYPATIRALTGALELSEDGHAALLGAVPKRVRPRANERSEFPALPSLNSALIGRERDLEAVLALLQQDTLRLMTLTGPGGVGKTVLAQRVADIVAPSYTNGARVHPARLHPGSEPRGLSSGKRIRRGSLGSSSADRSPRRGAARSPPALDTRQF